MADAVRTIVEYSDPKRYVVNLTNTSDGTGESAVTKVDISTLTCWNGSAPRSTKVMEARWSIQGFTAIRLAWNHTTPDVIALLSGTGSFDESGIDGRRDPKSAGGTGDIELTTDGEAANATYDITLVVELVA